MSTVALVARFGAPTPAAFRDRPNFKQAVRLASAYNEGAYEALRRFFEGKLPYVMQHPAAMLGLPDYSQLRAMLVGDHDCDDRIAMRAAFQVDASNRRMRALDPRFDGGL